MWWLVLGLVASAWAFGLCSVAAAQDPEAGLAEAEERAAALAAEIPDLKGALKPAQSRLDAASRKAAPVRSKLRSASARAAAIEHSLRNRRQHAAATVHRVEEERSDAREEHDKTVRAGIGLGIAALVLAAIALAWGWFRASAAVAYLVRMEFGQAIGLCVGGGLLAVIVGAAIGSADGAVGAVGYAVLALGFALPIAFVLARHSAEVQRGRANAYLRRDRLPARATRGLAGLFAALFLLCLGSAVFAGETKSGEADAHLRAQAAGSTLSSPALVAAESKTSRLEDQAAAVFFVLHRRQADLQAAKHRLGRAQTRLAQAEADERRFTRRLAAIEERELHELEREEREAQKLAEAEEREYEEALQEEEELAAEECDPNYSGCLDPNAVDYDCEGGSGDGPLYTGTVEVLGVDHYGLDDDGDGIGCDP
ncbi:MAG TPA: hypothetical protein VGI73_02740 [Solirubrobacterales bacterium]